MVSPFDRLKSENLPFKLNLTAFENTLSPKALQLLSHDLSTAYFLGTRTGHSGSQKVQWLETIGLHRHSRIDELRDLTAEFFKERLKCAAVDMRLLSGVHAAMTTILSLSNVGDMVVSLDPTTGGHYATPKISAATGRKHKTFPVNIRSGEIDFSGGKNLEMTKLVFIDYGAPRYPSNLGDIRELFPNATIVYDASHTLGLLVGNQFEKVESLDVDIIQGNTHKSFPGPPRAIIASRSSELGNVISDSLSKYLVSHPSTGGFLALAQSAFEMSKHSDGYAYQMCRNAKQLEKSLTELGLDTASDAWRSTESHIVLLKSSRDHFENLTNSGILTTYKTISGEGYIRIGLQNISRLGLKGDAIEEIASFIYRSRDRSRVPDIANRVQKISIKHDEVKFVE